MTAAERAELRKLAEAATSGPWVQSRPFPSQVYPESGAGVDVLVAETARNEPENAAYIAAVNPAVVVALLDAFDAAETTLANCTAERDNYRGTVETLRGERDEARAMAPRWCRFPTMLTLMVGNVRIGVVGQLADGRWQALPMGGVGVDCDTDAEAARAVCDRLGLPYIEVPNGLDAP